MKKFIIYPLFFVLCSLFFESSASQGGENFAHCFRSSTVGSCPFIQANPELVIGDLSVHVRSSIELYDWYSDIELFETYIRWFPNTGAQMIMRIWASKIFGSVEYGWYGSFDHRDGCAFVEQNPVDAYSYVYMSLC